MSTIATRLNAYADAWAAIATPGIAAHWSPEHFRFYKAEEVRTFFTRWDDVLAYWDGNAAMHEKIVLTHTDVTEIDLPGGLRMGISRMHWDIRFASDAKDANGALQRFAGKAMGGDNHALSLWQDVDGEPKLVGWSETPDAATLYVTDLYYKAVSPGF